MPFKTIVYGLCIFGLIGCAPFGAGEQKEPPPKPATTTSAKTDATAKLGDVATALKPLHDAKKPAAPGDWLAQHKEAGQTFEEYRLSDPNRPTKDRTTIYLQPIGDFNETQTKLVGQTAELLSRFYHVPTKVLETLGPNVIPKAARRVNPNQGQPQVLTTYVLESVLRPNRPRDAVAVLALTTADLWPGKGWNFVFGQASLRNRVGVWSLSRYGDPENSEEDLNRFRRRMFKVAVHETGHMLGIKHCIAYECCMNGSNHLEEADSQPLWFCPADVQKIWWACKADPAKRYESLIEFAEKHGLPEEAKFWKTSLTRIQERQQLKHESSSRYE